MVGFQKEGQGQYPREIKDFTKPQFSNIKLDKEKEILTSATKFDDRFFSAKSFPFQSEAKSTFRFYPGSDNLGMQIFSRPQGGQIYSQIHPQNYSYMLLKNLQLSGKFLPKLKIGTEISKEEVDRDAELLNITEYTDMWMKNFKKFLSDTLLRDLLYEHRDNLDHLNKILKSSLNIQIVEEVVDDSERLGESFRGELAYLIKNSNFSFSNIRGNLEQMQNLSPNIEATNLNRYQLPRQEEENKKYHHIFFGDNETLLFILSRVEEKLRNFQNQRERAKIQKEVEDYNTFIGGNLEKTLFSKPLTGEKPGYSTNFYSYNYPQNIQRKSQGALGATHGVLPNPLVNKNKYDKIESYSDLLLTHNKSIEDTLKLLKSFLENRIRINDLINPVLLKEINYNHKQLIL
jgi:hypothetical protein